MGDRVFLRQEISRTENYRDQNFINCENREFPDGQHSPFVSYFRIATLDHKDNVRRGL